VLPLRPPKPPPKPAQPLGRLPNPPLGRPLGKLVGRVPLGKPVGRVPLGKSLGLAHCVLVLVVPPELLLEELEHAATRPRLAAPATTVAPRRSASFLFERDPVRAIPVPSTD
jgi:hypothetical protein